MAQKPYLHVALILGAMGALSSISLVPYVLALKPDALSNQAVPFPVLLLLQALQAFLIYTALAWAGVRLGLPTGLRAPLLFEWVFERKVRLPSSLWVACLLGVASAIVLIAVDYGMGHLLQTPLPSAPNVDRWRGVLASLYGGICEEILSRLFVMTTLVWLCWRLGGRRSSPSRAAFWFSIVTAALLFGAGHLPLAFQLMGVSPFVIFRTIALNSVAGITFGWLYWKYGLEHAMLSHLTLDLVIHGIMPA